MAVFLAGAHDSGCNFGEFVDEQVSWQYKGDGSMHMAAILENCVGARSWQYPWQARIIMAAVLENSLTG